MKGADALAALPDAAGGRGGMSPAPELAVPDVLFEEAVGSAADDGELGSPWAGVSPLPGLPVPELPFVEA